MFNAKDSEPKSKVFRHVTPTDIRWEASQQIHSKYKLSLSDQLSIWPLVETFGFQSVYSSTDFHIQRIQSFKRTPWGIITHQLLCLKAMLVKEVVFRSSRLNIHNQACLENHAFNYFAS